jgi:hypothetical protein
MEGKFALDQFLVSLGEAVAQLLIVEGLKFVLTGGKGGLFGSGYQKGGIIGAQSGAVLGGSSYSGDRQLFLGNTGEMVLNRQQQKNLLAMLTYGRIQNRLPQQKVLVELTGSVKAKQDNFVFDLRKAEQKFIQRRTVKNVDRN